MKKVSYIKTGSAGWSLTYEDGSTSYMPFVGSKQDHSCIAQYMSDLRDQLDICKEIHDMVEAQEVSILVARGLPGLAREK